MTMKAYFQMVFVLTELWQFGFFYFLFSLLKEAVSTVHLDDLNNPVL